MKIEMVVFGKNSYSLKEQSEFLLEMEKFLIEKDFPLLKIKVQYDDHQDQSLDSQMGISDSRVINGINGIKSAIKDIPNSILYEYLKLNELKKNGCLDNDCKCEDIDVSKMYSEDEKKCLKCGESHLYDC